MKRNLFFLFAAGLLVAFTPAKNTGIEKTNTQPAPLIVHTFHKVATGSDAVSYYVTLSFNLSTQSFVSASAHEDVLNPPAELDATVTGDGDTTGGDGSTIQTTGVVVSINSTSITIDIPDGTYPFDY